MRAAPHADGQPPGQDGAAQQQQQEPAEQQAGGSGQRRNEHDQRQLLFLGSYDYARRQHLSNLVFLLRQSAATRDWARLAGVVATLMASDRAENLTEHWIFRHPESRARLAEAMGAGWLLLQQEHPTALGYEQACRFLKQWAAYQLSPAGKEAVLLDLARFCRAQGHATDAWDMLSTQQFTTAAAEAQRFSLMAGIRMEAWAEAMRTAAEVQPVAQQQPVGSPNKRRRSGHGRSGPSWHPWQHQSQLWLRSGRLGKELHKEAVDCCKKALVQEPAASEVAAQLAQLHLAAGDMKDALAVAKQVQQHAPADADAAGLRTLLLVAQHDRPAQPSDEGTAGNAGEASAAQAADCCCHLLAADPSCHPAMAALLALHDRRPLLPPLLVSACCCYLEAQPPSWTPPLLELRVWQLLAATLTQASASVVSLWNRWQQLQQQRKALLPRSMREVQRLRQQRSQGQSEDVAGRSGRRLQQAQELGAAAMDVLPQLQRVLAVHKECCAVVEDRLWWRDAHLLPQPSATVAAELEAGTASPAALLAQAAVGAFMHPVWQQRTVDAWRRSGGATALPRLMQNRLTRHTAAALDHAGHKTEAAALRSAAKLCKAAAEAAAGGAGHLDAAAAAPALASFARQRADFWRAARKPWKPPAGWLPIPLGTTQPQLGRIAALPPQWWAVFPEYRKRQQQQAQQRAQQEQQQQQQQEQQHVRQQPGVQQAVAAAADGAGQGDGTQQEQQQQQQQAARALRRAQQQPRSILKGSQPQELGMEWEASQPAEQQPLLGTEPASGRLGRRVQFQLPTEGTGQEQGGAGGAMEEDGMEPGQQEQEQVAGPADQAAAAGGTHHGGKGKRKLLPRLPPSLAQEEGEHGEGSSHGAAWKKKLDSRRRARE